MRLFLILFCLFSFGCATTPVAFDSNKKEGRWETKALVRDLKNNKSNTVSIDFIAIKPDKLRAEVTGSLGISVATLVMSKDQIAYAVHTQKKFYQGSLSEKSLGPLLQIKMNPRILFYVLFDDPLPEASWDCRRGAAGLPEECKSKSTDFLVRWSDRNGESKRITISRTDFEVQVYVKSFSTKVQQDPGLFSLSIPESYKSYQLN